MPLLSRRRWLQGLASGAGVAAVSTRGSGATPVTAAARPVRIAHLTDIHVQPELESARGVAECLAHVQSLPQRTGGQAVDLVITGGDTIMDCMQADHARTRLQWDLWRKVLADHCGLEVHSVVGNHDVWGWTRSKAGTTGSEPLYGKRWACEQFGRSLPYTSFDRGRWHVVLLDSVFPHEESYVGRLDDAQWDWLETDLAAVQPDRHVLVVSHIPILAVHPLASTAAEGADSDGKPAFTLSGGLVHVDHPRLQALFARHRAVKACLSGHLHVVERIDFGGVRYFCNGAVSAGWWKGLHRGTDFGYAVVDLHDDGRVECGYVPYGWTVPG